MTEPNQKQKTPAEEADEILFELVRILARSMARQDHEAEQRAKTKGLDSDRPRNPSSENQDG